MVMTTKANSKSKRNGSLIAGVLQRSLAQPGFSAEERDTVRHAVREQRDVRDRTIDHVVDRLLKELTW